MTPKEYKAERREKFSLEILKSVLSNPRVQKGLDEICVDGKKPDVFEMNVLMSVKMANLLIERLDEEDDVEEGRTCFCKECDYCIVFYGGKGEKP